MLQSGLAPAMLPNGGVNCRAVAFTPEVIVSFDLPLRGCYLEQEGALGGCNPLWLTLIEALAVCMLQEPADTS